MVSNIALLDSHNNDDEFDLDQMRVKAIEIFEEVRSMRLPYPIEFNKDVSLSSEVRRFESYLIEYALDETNGNQVRAAELLNLNYTTLNAKVKRYGLDKELRKRESIASSFSPRETEFDSKLFLDEIELEENRGSIREKLGALKNVVRKLIEEIETLGFAKTIGTYDQIKLPQEIQRFETHLIRSALDRSGGSQTRAAKILGIKVTTLNNKIKRMGIPVRAKYGAKSPKDYSMLAANAEAQV